MPNAGASGGARTSDRFGDECVAGRREDGLELAGEAPDNALIATCRWLMYW
jgi:hypothetical protein